MRRLDLENNFERFVAGKEDKIEAREQARYDYAKTRVMGKTLDIGCSSGYGSRILTEWNHTITYTGVDYSHEIIDYARTEFPQHEFYQYDITHKSFEKFLKDQQFDTIIAFEVLEHVDNGREIAQMLKKHCRKLICSTPYNEIPGTWGPHHKLHGLTPKDFYGFNHEFMDWNGNITPKPTKDSVVMVFDWESPFVGGYNVIDAVKYSVIIPTYNHLEDCLAPCVKSVIENSNMDETEIIIVANGCRDNTIQWVQSHWLYQEKIFLFQYEEPLGYTRAANRGAIFASGDYIVFLNNDTIIHPSISNWLEILVEPFAKDLMTGETGSRRAPNHVPGLEDFIIGYCSMFSRKVLNEVGLMDEQFTPGGMDDVDLSIRVQRAGYSIHECNVPIYHPGRSSTMHDLGNWQEIFDENIRKLARKWAKEEHVLAEICTKNRYRTTLPGAVLGVLMQTRLPDRLIIYDDSDQKEDLQNDPQWKYLFSMLNFKGIQWEWIWTDGKGQHYSHQYAQDAATNFVWRIDDDTVAEPNVLENLIKYMNDPAVGAVGGKILTPPSGAKNSIASAKIADIYFAPNVQWFDNNEVIEAEHLHCSFLYRKGIANYELKLSPVAHREETLFTHEIFRAGYKVLIVPDAITWHLRNPEGGIRSHTNGEYWAHDERIFGEKMRQWGVIPINKHIINCALGLGDHYILLHALPKIIEKHGAENIVIVCYRPEIFEGLGVQCITEGESKTMNLPESIENVYGYCWKTNWKGPLVEAFERQNS